MNMNSYILLICIIYIYLNIVLIFFLMKYLPTNHSSSFFFIGMHPPYRLCVILHSLVSLHSNVKYLYLLVVLYFLDMDVEANFRMTTIGNTNECVSYIMKYKKFMWYIRNICFNWNNEPFINLSWEVSPWSYQVLATKKPWMHLHQYVKRKFNIYHLY